MCTMKTVRKLLCMILSLLLVFSLTTVALATEKENDSIVGLDRYFSMAPAGTIIFDMSAALDAGYTNNAVETVQARINYLNSLVTSGKAYINENYGAVVGSRTRSLTGHTYLVQNWDGSTDVFLSDNDAYYTKLAFDYVQRALDPTPILDYLDESAQPYVALACTMGMIQCGIYKNQISYAQADVAAAPAGEDWRVVMHIFYVDGMQNMTFYALESVV